MPLNLQDFKPVIAELKTVGPNTEAFAHHARRGCLNSISEMLERHLATPAKVVDASSVLSVEYSCAAVVMTPDDFWGFVRRAYSQGLHDGKDFMSPPVFNVHHKRPSNE